MTGSRGQGSVPVVVRRAAFVAIWIVLWQLASVAVGSDLLLAGPLDTVFALCSLVGQGAFWVRIAWSLARIAAGFVLAFALGMLLAALAAPRRWVADLLLVPMTVCKSTPVVCIVVLLLIWVGSRMVSLVAVLLVVLPAIYFSAIEAIRALDAEHMQMLRLYKVCPWRQAMAYIWPAMQPFLFATCKLVVGMSWKAGVAAELIGTPLGSIGERIYQAKILFETADLFAWTIVVVGMAWLCEKGVLALLAASATFSRRRAIPTSPTTGNPVQNVYAAEGISLSDVCKSYADTVVLAGENLSLEPGSRTCLMGPSGVGKTTTLEIIAGLETPDTGSAELPDSVALAWQRTCLIEHMSPVENVALTAGLRLSRETIRAMLAEVLPERTLDVAVEGLSGGERRRVELVRALASDANVVLLDEPFASLDEASHRVCADFILAHLSGRTLLVATHNRADAELLDAKIVSLG